jgi:diguanylate cyclase (GGDEF)-like protein/PAS domain S-box-containing protein
VKTHEQVLRLVKQHLKKGGSNHLEIEHLRKDGSVRMTQVSSRSVTIRGKGYLLAIWSDITERKKAERALMESEARYRFIADNTDDVIWLMDIRTGNFTYVSPSVEKLRGYTPEEVMAQPVEAALTTQSNRKAAGVLRRTLAAFAVGNDADRVVTIEVDQPRKDGSIVPTEVVTKVLTDDQGRVTSILGVTRDITQRKNSEEQIKLAASVFRDAREGIVITDAEGKIINANRAFTEITGFQRDEVFGQTPRALKSGRHEPEFYTRMWQQLLQTEHWSGELWNKRKNGEEYPEQLSISAVKDTSGKTTHYVGIFTDITEYKQQQEQIERLAYYDALTRLPNRVLLADRMQQALARADRKKKIVAVCYLDLDGFKPINDRYGHKAGDSVLTEISKRLQEFIRIEDTVARLGGDEFVLLLTDLASEEGSEPILARVLEIVTKPCELHTGVNVSVSASIGVTFYPTDHNDPDVLLRHADQAMYQAKQLGRNRMHPFDPKYDQQTKKLRELKTKVRAGLEQCDFVLYWQPKVDLVHGHVVGAEALLRWKQADASVLLPGTFLPQLENDDLIIEIGDYVFKEAVATLCRWHESGLDLSASVNVAARQMLSPDFMRKLREDMEGHADIASHLELEILETAALEDLDKVKRLINECKALGVGFALDDFGTGYSSMTYFRRLPVDTVKIDQSFVRDMLDNADDLAIVQGILGLTKAFGKTSVAEGVELIEQLSVLQSMGCHIAQGYAIGYPMPEQEFLRWLEDFKPDMTWAQRH